jgi:hypothetical protein
MTRGFSFNCPPFQVGGCLLILNFRDAQISIRSLALVPLLRGRSLTIFDRASLRGDLRTHKIHLCSGNILDDKATITRQIRQF